jgi:hypothetical protein
MLHILHKYSPWRDIKQAIFVRSDDVEGAKGTSFAPTERIKIIQERRCVRCNHVQLRTALS